MYLRRLFGTGVTGFSEWREMWNDEVLPYLLSLRPVGGPGTRIDRRDGGTVIRAVPAATAAVPPPADPEYSSYFKLSLVSSGGAVVTIADGATDGDSIAVVNGGTTYSLPPYSEVVSGARVFCLKYTPARYDSGGGIASSATMVISSVEGGVLPSGGTSGAYYMQLGRTVGSGAELRVVQDHTAGVAQFNWFVACNQYAGY